MSKEKGVRKFIVIVVASLVPVGMWTAGCRQDRQAAFPKTPEMKSLAKGSKSKKKSGDAPVIPEAPIDRDILNLPENATMARVNTANDRSQQMARTKVPEGLFSLPEDQDIYAMAPAAGDFGQGLEVRDAEAMTPIPSGREFWSKPPANRAARRPEAPEPMSTMAPNAPAMTPTTQYNSAPSGPALMPPVQYNSIPAPASPEGGKRLLPVEDVPGVFMGGEQFSYRGSPPATRPYYDGLPHRGGAHGAAPLLSSAEFESRPSRRADADARGRGPAERGPLKLDLTGLIGGDSPVPEYRHVSPVSPAVSPAIDRSIVVRGIPGDYEPLPEPIPLDQYLASVHRELGVQDIIEGARAEPEAIQPLAASMPAAPAMPVARETRKSSTSFKDMINGVMTLPIPGMDRSERRSGESKRAMASAPALPQESFDNVPVSAARSMSALTNSPDMEQALAPLPDLSQSGKVSAKKAEKAMAPISMPPPMPEPLPTPEMTAAKTALMQFERRDEETAAARGTDHFRTDFWEKKPVGMKDLDLQLPEPMPVAKPAGALPEATVAKMDAPSPAKPVVEELVPGAPMWIEAIPEAAPILLEMPEPSRTETEKVVPAAPQKVRLEPMRNVRIRNDAIGRIDSQAEVPPLKF